jgi:hypothetical protein
MTLIVLCQGSLIRVAGKKFPTQAVALTRRQRRRCRNRGGTVCGEVQSSQICCPSGRPCCGTARRPVCCPLGGQCLGDSCQCPSGETECSGACVNLLSDESNCGTCGKACPERVSCVDGSCECPSGETDCNGRCVDLDTDESNCGTCGNTCPAGASCVDRSCVCPPGTFVCEDPDFGPSCVECGCGVECPDGRVCCGGRCCPSGEVCCNSLEGTCAPPGTFCGA